MDTINNILVPLAFNDYSQGLFNYASKLAGHHDANLIVLSIINSRDLDSVESIVAMGYDVDADHYVEEIRKDRKERLNQIVNHARFDKSRVSILFKIGKPADEILKVIRQKSPDLVIMGTRGRSHMSNSIMGRVAEKVFKRSPVNVLSYRDEDAKEKLDKKLHF